MPQIRASQKDNRKEKVLPKGIRHFNCDEVKEPVFIGEGGFSKVYSGKYKESAVVVKIMKVADDEDTVGLNMKILSN